MHRPGTGPGISELKAWMLSLSRSGYQTEATAESGGGGPERQGCGGEWRAVTALIDSQILANR